MFAQQPIHRYTTNRANKNTRNALLHKTTLRKKNWTAQRFTAKKKKKEKHILSSAGGNISKKLREPPREESITFGSRISRLYPGGVFVALAIWLKLIKTLILAVKVSLPFTVKSRTSTRTGEINFFSRISGARNTFPQWNWFIFRRNRDYSRACRGTMGIPNELRGFLPRVYTRLCPGICARVSIYSSDGRSVQGFRENLDTEIVRIPTR